jgi:di/tricarboxylate transporter
MWLQQSYTAVVVATLIAVLISRKMGPDFAFLCALAALLAGGVLEPTDAIYGFANPAVITVGLLYIVALGLKETGGMTTITRRLLGRPKSLAAAQGRLLLPVAGLSAFVNNTPVVAMFLPVLSGWAQRNNINPSRLFIPLSFAAMLGGVCTLIGTSTNLVVNELLIDHVAHLEPLAVEDGLSVDQPRMGMFTLAGVGVPVLFAGLLFIILSGRRLLPGRDHATPISEDPRNYTVWMRVRASSGIVGRTIEQAGLRQLRGLFLSEIEREDELIVAPGPSTALREGDRLSFVGVIESVVELQQIQGLVPDTDQITKLDSARHDRSLIEAVVSEASPLVRKSVREAEFRTRYNAVIIAVHRAGERLRGKIGDIVLQPGDTLLLEGPPGFERRHRNSSAFYLVSELGTPASLRWRRAWIALLILAGLVSWIAVRPDQVMTAALCAAMAMIITRCCTGTQARQAVDWQVLIVIGSAFGIARAMERTELASTIAESVLGWTPTLGQYGMLAGIYLVTVLLTSVVTNNAAAALVFPIAFQFAEAHGIPLMPMAVCIAVGASAAFATPIGYQTNMMVMGPGGYSWGDFLRIGGPLTLLAGIICVLLAPLVYGS